MKKFIWISLLIIIALGCGSRSVQKEKTFQQVKDNTRQSESAEKQTETNIKAQFSSEANKSAFSEERQSKNSKATQNIESDSQKKETEKNSKVLKKTEYYPNGQKKSEMESSEQYSKVSEERDYYKNRAQHLEESLNISIKKQDSIYKQNLEFAEKNKELIKLNKETLSSLEITDKELKKATERKGISFGAIVWIVAGSLLSGAVLWEIIKKYVPKWRFKIFK